MIDTYTQLAALILKYGSIVFFIWLGVSIAVSLVRKLRDEPGTLFSVVAVTLLPFVLAIGIPYFVLDMWLQWPVLLNLVVGIVIYGASVSYLEKRVDTRFKDES